MASQETTEGGLGLPDDLRQVSEFPRYLRLRFIADRCTRAAASPSYASLLALVPLFTVVFVTVSAFPAFQGCRSNAYQKIRTKSHLGRDTLPDKGHCIGELDYLRFFTESRFVLQGSRV